MKEQIFKDYKNLIISRTSRILKHYRIVDSADAFQQAYLIAWECLDNYNPDKAAPATYIQQSLYYGLKIYLNKNNYNMFELSELLASSERESIVDFQETLDTDEKEIVETILYNQPRSKMQILRELVGQGYSWYKARQLLNSIQNKWCNCYE